MAVGRAAIPSQSPVAAALIAASAGAGPCPAPDSAAGSPDGTLLATFANGHLQTLCRSVGSAAQRGQSMLSRSALARNFRIKAAR